MNTDNLKKIKEELLEMQNQYVPIFQFSKNSVINAGVPILSEEIRVQENTYEVAKQCEILIKETVNFLTEKGVSFVQIVISSNMGVFCRLDYFNELKEYYQKNDKIDEKPDALMQTLHIKIFPKIVPVSFSINTTFIRTEDCNLDCFTDKIGLSHNDLSLKSVSGIVNWEQFVNEMNLLGYNVGFSNYEKGLSFFDYSMAVKQNGFDTQINITAGLGRTKKYTLTKI